jgi:hypothetical protein
MFENKGTHEHEVRLINGQPTCIYCHAVVITPILSDDDPRLGAQDNRFIGEGQSKLEERADPWWEDMRVPPLPFVLVDMWEDDYAPPAPYIEEVCHGSRLTCVDDFTELFSVLARMV